MRRTDCVSFERVRNEGGFTLGEVLATVLLVGLLTLAVATGIGVAINAYEDIRSYSEEQAVLDNAVTAVTDELRFAYDVSVVPGLAGTGDKVESVAFSSTVRDARIYLGNADGSLALYGAGHAGGGANPEQVTSLGESVPLPLVNTAAGNSGGTHFAAELSKLEYQDGLWVFSITVTGGMRTVESGDIAVRAINHW